MTGAYDRIYLEQSRRNLGGMLDYAVYILQYDLATFWQLFLVSPLSRQFEKGNVSVLAGRSGIELALMVAGKEKQYPRPLFWADRSEEYWLGWSLAYYQWKTGMSFGQITATIPIQELLSLYSPYHEMDIRQFCDRVSEIIAQRRPQTQLKQADNGDEPSPVHNFICSS